MRLTRYDKQAFVRAVMQDIPKNDDESLFNEIQAKLVEDMSEECRFIYNRNPRALRAEWESEPFDRSNYTIVVGDADYEKVTLPYRERSREISNIRRQLTSIIEGCSTLKQAKERLPDFVKYLPSETPSGKIANLPVDSLKKGLRGLGWPKCTEEANGV